MLGEASSGFLLQVNGVDKSCTAAGPMLYGGACSHTIVSNRFAINAVDKGRLESRSVLALRHTITTSQALLALRIQRMDCCYNRCCCLRRQISRLTMGTGQSGSCGHCSAWTALQS